MLGSRLEALWLTNFWKVDQRRCVIVKNFQPVLLLRFGRRMRKGSGPIQVMLSCLLYRRRNTSNVLLVYCALAGSLRQLYQRVVGGGREKMLISWVSQESDQSFSFLFFAFHENVKASFICCNS